MGRARLTAEHRGPIGMWAWDQRHAAGLTAEDVVDRLEETGIKMRASSYRGIEAGSYRPGPEVLTALEALYGSQAPEVEPRGGRAGEEALRAALSAVVATVEALEARLAGVEAALADHQAIRHAGRARDGSAR